MRPKIFCVLIASTFILSQRASAHSAYWECAAASGSNEAALANCGTRDDFNNRQAQQSNDEAEQQRRQQQQQQEQEENDRRNRMQREEEDRRNEDDRRRRAADEEEEQRRRASSNDSYQDSGSYSRARPTRQRFSVPVTVNAHVANRSVSLASSLDIARRNGYTVSAIRLQIQATGPSTTSIVAHGRTIATVKTAKAGAISKSVAIPRSVAAGGLSLSVKGDIYLKTITLTLNPR